MRRNVRLLLSACTALFVCAVASAQESKFVDRLLKNRYQLTVQDGHFSGSAAPVLKDAMADAQFVLLGEDHGIAQIPQFAGALCAALAPEGFHTMAVETGPLAAQELEQWASQKDGYDHLVSFEKQFPDSIAFYNFQEEFDLLRGCAHSATGGKFQLWGLDQELMGASGLLFTRILETHPGKEASTAAQKLLQKNDDAYAKAAKSGNPGDVYMMSASDDDLNNLSELLKTQGNAAAQSLMAALIESRQIYQKNMSGAGADSNRQRALLMKTTFLKDYRRAERAEGHAPKVFFKFGDFHMGKGFNLLHNNDLGNFVAELADGRRTKSLHISILAVKGSQLHFAGIGQPYQASDFSLAADKDSDFLFLKPMFEDLVEGGGWTMFDLRGLRPGFRSLGPMDKELERMIFGYDLLVLIPEAKPSQQVR